MPPRIPDAQPDRPRDLRREQAIAEDMLWHALRHRAFGVKFRRQVPIGAFIADFACVERKVVVEMRGPEPAEGFELRRDRCFRDNGWHVVRVSNASVTDGSEVSLDLIRAALAASPSADPG